MSFRGLFGLSKENHSRRQYDQHGMNSPSQPHRHIQSTGGWVQSSAAATARHNASFNRVQDNTGPQSPVSTQFFQKMIVLHDHYPVREMELAVRKGEKVEVVKKEPEWFFVRNERGKEGYVPARNCIAPVTRRTRSNSRTSMPIRPVKSGEIIEPASSNGGSRSRGGVPMYASSSAGKVRRYDSPMSDFEHDPNSPLQRLNSPACLISPANDLPSTSDTNGCSLSSSSGVSLMDNSSIALTRTFSQDELKPRNDDHSVFSLSQSAIDPNTMTTGGSRILLDLAGHHKHSSSEDSGTADSTNLRDPEYASTIRNGDSSGEESKLKLERVSSGSVTPSMRDRPLPSPPSVNGQVTKEETPPPVPPRHASLETSRQRGTVTTLVSPITQDDLNPYAQPVDSLINGTNEEKVLPIFQQQKGGSRGSVDISEQNSGVDSPYSEVYCPQQQNRRPVNVQDSPFSSRKPHRNQRNTGPIVRRPSPLINGNDFESTEHDSEKRQPKGIMKFRKYLWGVFICMKDFEALDENEVSVRAGEQVLVFNQDDQFWYWVVKHKTDQSEGFVPSSILRVVDDKKTTSSTEPLPVKVTGSPPNVPTTRPRGHTVSSLLSNNNTNPRTRVRSISSNVFPTSSIEKVPLDSDTSRNVHGPSSPPPPYAEQDPISHLSQPTSHDNHMTSNNHSMPRTNIMRNRPPTYPRTRSSTSQMYPNPNTPLTPGMYPGYISQSATRLSHTSGNRFHEHQSSYPCSPVTSTGGTLV